MTDTTRAQLFAAVARTPSSTRRQARLRSALCYAAAAAWMAAAFVFGHDAAPHSEHASRWTGAVVSGLIGVACAMTSLITARGNSPLGRSTFTLASICFGIPSTVLAWLAFWSPAALAQEVPTGFRCLGFTLLIGVAPLLALFGVRRGLDPVHPHWLGAALGALSGAWSAVLVAGWCPLFDWSHALLGHAAPIVVLSAAGAAIGNAILGVRRLPRPGQSPSEQHASRNE
jgi:hypothetical protein